MIASVVNWQLRQIGSVLEFEDHFNELARQCPPRGLSVWPELAVLELLHLHPEVQERDVPRALAEYADVWERLVQSVSGYCVGGSHIVRRGDQFFNVCLSKGETERVQPKVKLTQWEAVEWGLTPGSGLVQLDPPELGVTICYDSEFPEAGRRLAERGVLAQCVPSYTETVRGFQRVRWSCRARAIENQVFVLHASLTGSLGREPVPSAYGSSAILTPSLPEFPQDAVLAQTPLNAEGVAVAELDFDALLVARESGDVRNWHDRADTWG